MRTARSTLLAVSLLPVLAAPPARAGEIAIEAHGGYFDMAAENPASALFDSTGGATFGGALRYTFWKGAFVSAGARTFSKERERVFVEKPNAPVQNSRCLSPATPPDAPGGGRRNAGGGALRARRSRPATPRGRRRAASCASTSRAAPAIGYGSHPIAAGGTCRIAWTASAPTM